MLFKHKIRYTLLDQDKPANLTVTWICETRAGAEKASSRSPKLLKIIISPHVSTNFSAILTIIFRKIGDQEDQWVAATVSLNKYTVPVTLSI